MEIKHTMIFHMRIIPFWNMHRGQPQNSSFQLTYLSSKSEHNSSNLTLVRVVSMCFGPSAVAVMKGKL